MSLKEEDGMLGIDHQHGRYQTGEPGADAGVCGRRRGGRVSGRRQGRDVRVCGAGATPSELPASGAGRQGTNQAVFEQAHRIGPRPVDAADRALYNEADVRLLASVDQAHGTLSGPATRRILQREYGEYHIEAYQRLAAISSAQIYRFRKTAEYRQRHTRYQPTRPTPIPIGERRKPDPNGRPGYLRIDTVHQGDQDGVKGLYHINAVDQVTQWQVVGATPYISEAWLLPLLEAMLEHFPFRIRGFHSDNGSEFINYQVSGLLNKLLIEQTKSRPRHSGDNALVESKNGSVIRKHLGWTHIASQHAAAVNLFHRQHLNPYLNFHRPCGIPELRTLARGKIKRVYRQWDTPWDILRGLPDWKTTLRTDTSAEELQRRASLQSDTDAAVALQQAKRDLFRQLKRRSA